MTTEPLNPEAIRARVDAATPGPWEAGDWWHIQGAKFCLCDPQWGEAVEKRMRINGTMMDAHIHRRDMTWNKRSIQTPPYADGFPRTVVNTTEEYGAMRDKDAEFIAHARTDIPALLAENAALSTQLAEAEAKGYDEALKAFAWCLDNGPAEHALPYVIEHNPYFATRSQEPPTGGHE